MNELRLRFIFVLIGFTNAQYTGPYASFTSWLNNGCNDTINNYVTSLFLYPADGSCFSPSSNNGPLSSSYAYKITYNNTTIQLTTFYTQQCNKGIYQADYPRDACATFSDYSVASIYQTLPPDQYWVDLGIFGPGDQKWETVLITSYYSSLGCNNFTDIEIQGWEECRSGANYYCQNSKVHRDTCTDSTTCAAGCYEVYAPLSNACTATSDAPVGWSPYLNTGYASSYQATCAGTDPSDSTSSDGPTKGAWVLLMIIYFLVIATC